MKAHNTITVLMAVAISLFLAVSCSESSYVQITGYAQGGTYVVTVNTNGASVKPEVMKHSIDSILNVIDFSVSGYNKESLLSKFNAGETIVPDHVFMDLYQRSRQFWEDSDGVLDVASAPLFDLWGFGFTSDSMPSDETVSETLNTCGMARLVSDMASVIGADGTLAPADLLLDKSETVLPRLNYNAVAQGYSVDLIAEYLYGVGVADMLINVGGEIFCDGLNSRGEKWTLGIDRPEDGNNTPGADMQEIFHAPGEACGIVTSGNYRKFYVKDGKKYSHSIDPRSGYPVDHSLLSATVVSVSDGTDHGTFLSTWADALATECMVLGVEKAASYIESLQGVEACLIYDNEGEMQTWTSSGFSLD